MNTPGPHPSPKNRFWSQLVVASLLVFSGATANAQERDVEGAKRWQLGEPAPLGYHVARKHTLGIVGGSLLAGGYGVSVLYGVALRSECYVPGADGSNSTPCSAEPLYRAAPLLFIPIAGPFLSLGNEAVRRDSGAVFWFSTFGTIQLVGAVLLAYDLAVPHYGLKRGDTTSTLVAPRFSLSPGYLEKKPGLVLVGQF